MKHEREEKDKRSKHESEERDRAKNEHEPESIDWEANREYLDPLFFKRSDLIKVGTQDYHDFWGMSTKKKKKLK